MHERARPLRSAGIARGRARVAARFAALACLLAGACGDDGEGHPPARDAPPRGYAQRASELAQPAAPTPAPAQPAADPYADPLAYARAAQEAAAEAQAEAEKKKRDYAAELAEAAAGAESCVQTRTAGQGLPSELAITLEALVLQSGAVVTASARGPVLTPEELECVKKRLESTRIPGEVEDAPRRIQATLKLAFRPLEPAKLTAQTEPAPDTAAPQAAAPPRPGQAPPDPTAAETYDPPGPTAAETYDPPGPAAAETYDPPAPIAPEEHDPPEQVLPAQVPRAN